MLCFATRPDVSAGCAPELGEPDGAGLVQHVGRRVQPRLLLPGRLAEPPVRRQREHLRDADRELAAGCRAARLGIPRRGIRWAIAMDAAWASPSPLRPCACTSSAPSIPTARSSRRRSPSGQESCACSRPSATSRSARGCPDRRSGRGSRWHRSCSSTLGRSARSGSSSSSRSASSRADGSPFGDSSRRAQLLVARSDRGRGTVLRRLDPVRREPVEPGRGVGRPPRERHVRAGVHLHDPHDARLPAAGDRLLRMDRRATAPVDVLAVRRGIRGARRARLHRHAPSQRAGARDGGRRRRCSCRRSCRRYSVHQTGIIWQGRYGLFLYLGITIVAAWLLSRDAPAVDYPRGACLVGRRFAASRSSACSRSSS